MRKFTPYKPRIGSISHGTLRTLDLLDTFVSEIQRSRLTKAQRKLVNDCKRVVRLEADDEEAGHYLDELFNVMDELALPYMYFGAHEGDGSDFGYWPSIESIQEDMRTRELANADKVSDDFTGLAVEVNDHGNMTLFQYKRGKRVILWDCV
jgi:hypothetical protein